ncbi:MAG: UDP-N-acetylmuramate dehydrogenase [Clostridia bacterium]
MTNNEIEKLTKEMQEFINKEDIYANEPMSKHTTFKIGGTADIFVKLRSTEQIERLINLCNEKNVPIKVIGNGSNILVKDNGVRGVVAKICTNSYEFLDEETIRVDAGMLNVKVSMILVEYSLTGFEFASGIPGTIGGAVKMNAGAYGSQMSDVVVKTKYIDLKDMQIKEINNTEQKFEYRKSLFSTTPSIIIDTTLQLKKAEKEEIQKKISKNNESRKTKQPIEKPSAGSTFKRGKNFITAQLIDECGLKGYTVGGAQVSTKHAGFIVNTGNATASDVIKLVEIIKQKVQEKFNKDIDLEIEIIGE